MSEEDAFREAMADVVPLESKPRVDARGKGLSEEQSRRARENAIGEKPKPVPGTLTLGEVPQLQPRDVLSWKKEGVQELVMDRLRRGGYEPAATLDLHGERIKAARRMVHEFLLEAVEREARCVLISHGRGEKSHTPAQMKSYVAAWLEAHELVNAFVSAPRHLGGTGSVLVLMSKSAAAREQTRQEHGGKGEP